MNEKEIKVLGLPNIRLSPWWWAALIALATGGVMTSVSGNTIWGVGGWLISIGLWYFYGRLLQMFMASSLMAMSMKAALLDVLQKLEDEVESKKSKLN